MTFIAHRRGKRAEKLAVNFLTRQGMRCLQKNFSCRYGEIDLIMQQRQLLVFVEVRWRSYRGWGGSLASVDWGKQQRLIRTAQYFLQRYSDPDVACRFDVIGFDRTGKITWVQDAFC